MVSGFAKLLLTYFNLNITLTNARIRLDSKFQCKRSILGFKITGVDSRVLVPSPALDRWNHTIL